MIRVVSWNLNFSERTINEYEPFDWGHRSAYVLAQIRHLMRGDDSSRVIFAFQEVMPGYIDDLGSVLSRTHSIHIKEVHPCGRALYTAFPLHLNVEPFVCAPLQGKRDCWDIFLIGDYPRTGGWTLINCHIPMDAKYRLPICDHIARCPLRDVVWVGDFNSFSDGDGYEQCP